jgi:hypothetical protein
LEWVLRKRDEERREVRRRRPKGIIKSIDGLDVDVVVVVVDARSLALSLSRSWAAFRC